MRTKFQRLTIVATAALWAVIFLFAIAELPVIQAAYVATLVLLALALLYLIFIVVMKWIERGE